MPMDQPIPPDPSWPRYSARPFPPYRYVPGRSPHPKQSPQGHAYGKPEEHPPAADPARFRESPTYLYAVDLYNHAYWWECHEAFEGLWLAAGRTPPPGQFLQGIIQIAAANLKRFMGKDEIARKLADEGLARMKAVSGVYMGVDVEVFARETREYFEGKRTMPALIRLGD